MGIKHSKIKNTGLLFELLIRQITADTLSGESSPSIEILKKTFAKTELGKEYKLYETLFKQKSITETKANIVINTVLEASKKLNRSKLRREKYNLIKEIKNHYDLEEFFNHKVSNYKEYAAFYTLLEIYNSDKISETNQIIDNKLTILESLTQTQVNKTKVKEDLLEEFRKYDKDLRVLTYKVMLEKFNGKYANLNDSQKDILKEFINSIDNAPKLREFYNQKINEVKTSLKNSLPKITNPGVKIKLNEILSLIHGVDKTAKVKNDDLVNLLQYYELTEELKRIH
jgi:hypothetical protein